MASMLFPIKDKTEKVTVQNLLLLQREKDHLNKIISELGVYPHPSLCICYEHGTTVRIGNEERAIISQLLQIHVNSIDEYIKSAEDLLQQDKEDK